MKKKWIPILSLPLTTSQVATHHILCVPWTIWKRTKIIIIKVRWRKKNKIVNYISNNLIWQKFVFSFFFFCFCCVFFRQFSSFPIFLQLLSCVSKFHVRCNNVRMCFTSFLNVCTVHTLSYKRQQKNNENGKS